MIGKNLLARVKLQAWLWIHFKLALLVWSFLLFYYTPIQVHNVQGDIVTGLFTIVTGMGAIISVTGLVVKNQGCESTLIGSEIELAGLVFMAAGPISYLVTQIFLALTLPDGDQRYALCALTYALCAALVCRIAIVYDHFAKHVRVPKVTV
jgi:hypothetical protein